MKTAPLEYTSKANKASKTLKDVIANSTLLRHPKSDASYTIKVNASEGAIGAVLQQKEGDNWHLLYLEKAVFGRGSIQHIGRELLAIYLALRHFRHFAKGRNFFF